MFRFRFENKQCHSLAPVRRHYTSNFFCTRQKLYFDITRCFWSRRELFIHIRAIKINKESVLSKYLDYHSNTARCYSWVVTHIEEDLPLIYSNKSIFTFTVQCVIMRTRVNYQSYANWASLQFLTPIFTFLLVKLFRIVSLNSA